MNKTIRIIIATLLSLTLFNCSTYTVKKDMSKRGELTKTPKWYIKYKREDKADRINGKMNNQSSINKSETGIDENNNITGSAEDTIINLINDTLVRDYIVEKVEIFYTHHKSYRAYVKLKVSKENVSLVIQEIKADKKLVQNNKNQKKLSSKVKEVLKNLD